MNKLRSFRFRLVFLPCAALVLLAVVGPDATVQAAVPQMTTYQGLLLDSANQPVTGTFAMVFSIYDSPTGGVALWTEDHVGVSVASGLFSVELGSVVPLSVDVLVGGSSGLPMRYLQLQLPGEAPLSPRTALLAAPYALASGRVSGDIETAPGSIVISDGSHDRAKLTTVGSVTNVGTWDVTNGNSTQLYTDTDSAGLAIRIEDRHLIGLRVNKGINEPLPYTTLHLSDISGNGLSSLVCTEDSVVERHNVLENGISTTELSEAIARTGAMMTIRAQGASQHQGVANIGAVLNGNVVIGCLSHTDASGVAENGCTMTTDDSSSTSTTSSSRGKYYVQGATHNYGGGSSRLGVVADVDADGHAERSIWQTVDSSEALSVVVVDVDDDGNPDVGSSMEVDETRSTLKTYFETGDVPTQGRSHITDSVDVDGSSTEMQTRLNGLPPGTPAIGTLTMSTNVTKCDVNLGNVTDESRIELTSSSGPLPGYSPSSMLRLGRPAINEALVVSDESGVSVNAHAGGRNIGLYVSDVSGQCKMAMVDATMGAEDTTIMIDGTLKRFGIGVAKPDYPIHHSSGARLSAAGDWENASDENLKEHFSRVESKELLEQIDELPINRWNYKADADEVIHIGPTAQDFRRVFGVGRDDKTISTIDPSGIALAAIKELNKQNRKLQAQNEELKRQLDELAQEVEKLAAAR